MVTYLGSLVQLCCCREGGTLQTGSARSVWTTLGLPQLTVACAFRVYTAQAPGCIARALSKVSPADKSHWRVWGELAVSQPGS